MVMCLSNSFLLGNKKKLWIIIDKGFNINNGFSLVEAKNYYLSDIEINLPCSERFSSNQLATINLEMSVRLKDLAYEFSTNENLCPSNFYSIPELTKLSKIISRKLSSLKD